MDVAKAISVLAKNEGKASSTSALGLVKKPGLPSIMVPTRQERHEVTFTSVFTMRAPRPKEGSTAPILSSHGHPGPEAHPEPSAGVSATTGMDALTMPLSPHSLQAHFYERVRFLRAIEILAANLRGAVFDGAAVRIPGNMMQGRLFAGLGLAMAGVGAVAMHLAYPLGAMFDILTAWPTPSCCPMYWS